MASGARGRPPGAGGTGPDRSSKTSTRSSASTQFRRHSLPDLSAPTGDSPRPTGPLLPLVLGHVRAVLGVIADGPAAVLQVVKGPVAVGHPEHHLVLHPGVNDGLLEDAERVAVTQLVRVLGLVAFEVEVADAVAGVFIYINYRGASETGKIGAIMTLLQTLFLVVIGGIGVWVAIRHPSRLANFKPFLNAEQGGWSALLVTMGFTAVAFEGYEVIAQAGDETIDPKRNIPKAMLYSVFIVTITYVLCAFATVVAVKTGSDGLVSVVTDGVARRVAAWEWIGLQGEHGAQGFGAAVEQLIPAGGGLLVLLAVIFASTSALNATIYSATRASYALGRDRMLPGIFAKISPVRKTPWVALAATGGIVVVVATCLNTGQVAASASIMFLFLFFLVNICVVRIRYNMGDELEYGFLMPFFPLLPVLAIISQAVLAVFLHEMEKSAWVIAPLWVGTGVLIYRFYSRSRAVPTADEIHVFEEERAEPGEGYRIMVAVANPDNALSMVRNTYALCGAKEARVELLHMVPVPDQVPLSDAEAYMGEGREAIGETMLYLAPLFPISTTIRYCRNVARGIVSAVREKQINMLIMGWHGRSGSRSFALGSTVDPVIERVPCNVVILKNCGDQRAQHVLVPVAGGPNSAFALEIAGILADVKVGRITVLTVQSPARARTFDLEQFLVDNQERIGVPRDRIETKIVEEERVERAILQESRNPKMAYDLVVMGATHEPLLYRYTRESVPEIVARECTRPFVMVKATGGLRSWVRRWI